MQEIQSSEDLITIETNFNRADGGRRLANYLIDLVCFFILIILVVVIIGIFAPDSLDAFLNDESEASGLLDRLLSILLFAIFMGIQESIFKGKSIGKFLTKTRAVNLDGSRITTAKAFERGFSRAVPFCVFSALGTPCNPWQDRWTNTMVIDERAPY